MKLIPEQILIQPIHLLIGFILLLLGYGLGTADLFEYKVIAQPSTIERTYVTIQTAYDSRFYQEGYDIKSFSEPEVKK